MVKILKLVWDALPVYLIWWVVSVLFAIGSTWYLVDSSADREITSIQEHYDEVIRKANTAHASALLLQKTAQSTLIGELRQKLEVAQTHKQEIVTIVKEVPRYVTRQADRNCTITAGFAWMHDRPLLAAATAGVPPSEPRDVDAPTGIAASTVAATVANNYAECEARGEVIAVWQKWYAEQKNIFDKSQQVLSQGMK